MKITKSNLLKANYSHKNYSQTKKPKAYPCYNNFAYSSDNLKANFLNFKGNAPKITNARIITGSGEDIPLLATQQNNSYIVDFDSQTELVYGKDAINFLNSTIFFKYDTQIIFPKKAQGNVTVDDKTIELKENSAIVINQNSKAKIEVKKGYPMIVISKKDYNWYERYSKEAHNPDIRKKFEELMLFNSHLYNGEFASDILLNEKMRDESFLNSIGINKWNSRTRLIDEIYNKKDSLSGEDKKEISEVKTLLDKMFSLGLFQKADDNYIRPTYLFNKNFYKKFLNEQGFNETEISKILPILDTVRQAKIDSRFIIKNEAQNYSQETITKLKQTGILHDNKKDVGNFIFWKNCFSSPDNLRKELIKQGFNEQEQEEIIAFWHKANKSGLDVSGLKFINDNLAIYSLDDKLNNWTLEKTNWITNSTAPTSKKGITPFIGVSMVQTDKIGPIAISELRKEEKLHSHPNFAEKRQTEVYLVTSGMAALNIVKDGKSQIKILKEGELAIVEAGVAHCINSVLGEYEHIVTQVPSAFQYGFGFKQNVDEPSDYDTQRLTQEAFLAFKMI